MIGKIFNRLTSSAKLRDGHSFLLSQIEFQREVTRERMRAVRRAIPFCILNIELAGRDKLRQRRNSLIQLLHRNVRLTDHKAELDSHRFAVLFVDTPEMGGRAALDRIETLCQSRGIHAKLTLKVHDPEGFAPDDVPPTDHSGGRRVDDSDDSITAPAWTRFDFSEQESDGSSGVALASNSNSTSCSQVRRTRTATSPRSGLEYTPVDWYAADSSLSHSITRRLIKRVIDLVGASIGLVLVSPVLVGCAIAIKLTSPGPVFYRQIREGRGGKPFVIIKLRTMAVDAENHQLSLKDSSHRDGPAFKIKDDPRVTPVGNVLRKTCIDELPQLINVLKGEMSLVGPRPLPWQESRACSSWHRRRLDVKPGMTCHWQINKSAAPTFDDWMRLDLQYVDRSSTLQDLQLIARTTVVPMMGRGSE
ncbi:sugar transferase [Stieleria sp. JC731]|uniref:sugar transferase n=1 Tax=Pirellulaceae TaxID=2691357 RepID=UPI001E2CE9DB|nr:sugar transferase [Stieleria sp. JC731]MCC9604076.1 sugar transferase [Stieleria sp. JC731]